MWINGAWGWMPWMWIFPLVFLVLMVTFIVYMMRGGMGNGPMCDSHQAHGSSTTAREQLDRRYARGEISREEYRQIRKDLD